jgi:hypothetical protein
VYEEPENLYDVDPFAKTDGVRMFSPSPSGEYSRPSSRNGTHKPRDYLADHSIPTTQEHEFRAVRLGAEGSNPNFVFNLATLLSEPATLGCLLTYLSFYDWCMLCSVSNQIRALFGDRRELREEALERYLTTVGYARWTSSEPEPLALSLMVCISIFASRICWH